jgi:hypothetical protein
MTINYETGLPYLSSGLLSQYSHKEENDMTDPDYCSLCGYSIASKFAKDGEVVYGKRVCGDCFPGAVALCLSLLEHVNATVEVDMPRGNPITGAHHRAIEAERERLREGL